MSPERLPEFLARQFEEFTFPIRPYVVGGGVTLLYGKTRVGKSPLTWEMARCIASGEPFFRYPTTKGRVLYLDLDTPAALVQHRLALLDTPPEDFWVEFPPMRNIFLAVTQTRLKQYQAEVEPTAVFINTLRKLHEGDEKDAAQPHRVYDTLRSIFRGAGIVVVHHDKKTQGKDQAGDPDEAFSGHMAWLNDCQIGLHLVPAGGHVPGLLRLWNTKNQVAAQEEPWTLQLAANGTHISDYLAYKATAVIKLYHELPETMGKSDRVHVISQRLECSERTVWTYLSRLPDPPTEITENR